MNELIKVNQEEINNQQVKTVNAKGLHLFLEVGKDFSDWIKGRIKKYRFSEGVDYVVVKSTPQNGGVAIDYHLTLDMAKEISMVERNKKGKEARQYFIECERIAQQPQFQIPQNLGDALQLAADLAKQVELDAPKVALAEKIEGSKNSIKIGDFVKAISRAGEFIIGRNNFFGWLKFEQIITNKNMPYQKYINNGWLEVRESTYEHKNSNGPRSCFTTLVTGRGQIAVLDRFKKSNYSQKFLNKATA